MIIKQCNGYELEKEKKNTSEDYFNRSEVVFSEGGEERTFHVLYVRYFDELMSKFTPYEEDPIFSTVKRDVTFKDIVAVCCLLKNPEFKRRKRVYINSEKDFAEMFKGIDFDKLTTLISTLDEKQEVEVRSSLEFINQPAH